MVTRYTDSLSAVAIALAGSNLLGLLVLLPALARRPAKLPAIVGDEPKTFRLSKLRHRSSSQRIDVTGPAVSLFGVVLSVLLATALVVDYRRSVFLLAVLGVVALSAIQLLTWRTALGCFPFASVPLLVLNAVGLLGASFYGRFADNAVSASLPTSPAISHRATLLFLVASLAMWFGGLCATIGARRRSSIPAFNFRSLARSATRWKILPIVIASTIPLVCGIAGLSISGMWRRSSYLETGGPVVLVKLALLLLPVGLAGTAILLFSPTHRRGRFWGVLLLALYTAYLISKSSRALALVPVVILGIYVLMSHGLRTRRGISILAGIATLLLALFSLHLALALREGDAGLGPYFARAASDPGILWGVHLSDVLGNVLFSVPLTGFIALHDTRLPFSYFLTSINPLPGSLTDWGFIKNGLRVNANTPFNTLGELALYGAPVLAGYFAAVAFVTTRLQMKASKLVGLENLLAHLVVAACATLFSVSVLQYNVRSSTRAVWYAVLVVVALQVFSRRYVILDVAPEGQSHTGAPRPVADVGEGA